MRRAIAYLVIAPLAALTTVLVWHAYLTPPEPEPAAPPISAEERATRRFAADYNIRVRPFVQTYCVECHAGAKPEAGLDLAGFSNFDAVTKDPAHWSLVLERLRAGEMPPDDAKKHPAVAQRTPVVAWLEALRLAEAKRRAGDPGLVLARRLSNAEFDYTIRDLTGVDLRPAKEFPVDPANEAGFDNSGESLAMSPSLVKKYLEAAQSVADHLVFKPDGLAFSPIPVVTDEDRDNYAVHRIVDFYKRQGLDVGAQFLHYMGQSPDYTKYFRALWRFQNRAALGRPSVTLADLAKDDSLSLKYLGKLQDFLALPGGEAGPVVAIQARWRTLPAPADGQEPPALATQLGFLRDFIAELRPFVTKTVANLLPNERIIGGGSQTLVLWKDRQYAANRLTYPTGMALETDMTYYASSDPAMLIPTTEAGRASYEESFKKFCAVFPDAFVVWERARMFLANNSGEIQSDLKGHRLLTAGFHSQMGYFRDDAPLCELMLDDAQRAELDRLWVELNFIAQVPFRQFRQFVWFERGEPPSFMFTPEFNAYRSEDDDLLTEAKLNKLAEDYTAKAVKANMTAPAMQAVKDYFPAMNAAIRQLEKARTEAEPRQLDALLAFAQRAYRRPLTPAEQEDLLAFYHTLRAQKLGHEDAVRDCVVSVLMSPNFGLRVALPRIVAQAAVAPTGPGRLASAARSTPAVAVEPLSDYELASRLSYFLWSTMPDEGLLAHAASGDLHRPEVLAAEARRMMADDRIRGLATEFGGNWLDIRRFEEHNAVDRERFPEFTNELREAMFEEPVRFFADLVRRDGSVLDFIYGNYTFVNAALARHYGMPVPAAPAPDGWARVDDAGKYARGGLLPMAAFLTKNAPGLRTSPVKRGHWVVTKLLGEHIPAPPPNVPVLPTDETKLGDLTLRETLARHRADPTCASCHNKFDSFGLVFEGYGPVGEQRANDLAGRPVQLDATFPDGSERAGLAGLKSYIQTKVQDEFLDNLARKLTAYALGRTLLFSDDLLIADLKAKLTANDNSFGSLVESLVTSPQFLNKRAPVAPTGLATN